MDNNHHRTVGAITVAGSLALIGVAVVWEVSPTGTWLTVIGTARACFLLGLLAVAHSLRAQSARSRLGALGMALAGLGAPLTLLGAVVHGFIGGWDFDPFENADAAPPWYSVVIALGAIAFATGSVLVGAAHLRNPTARTPAALLIAGGVMYVPAIPLGGLGHALWALPWLGIGAVLVTLRSEPRSDVRVPVRATRH